LPLLGQRTAAGLSVADMRRLLDTLAAKRLAPRSLSGLLGILSSVVTYGVREGVVARNVVCDLAREDRPGAQRKSEPRYLSPDELDLLLAKMGDTFRPVAAACAYAGLRLSEALGLRWRDVDFAAATCTVGAQLGPSRGKGLRTLPWAFSSGKRPQSAGKPGHRPARRHRRKALHIGLTQQ
jgi:integrase